MKQWVGNIEMFMVAVVESDGKGIPLNDEWYLWLLSILSHHNYYHRYSDFVLTVENRCWTLAHGFYVPF